MQNFEKNNDWKKTLRSCMFNKKESLEDSFLNIVEYIKKNELETEEMRKKLAEYNKDKEIVALNEKIQDLEKELYSGRNFIVLPEENEKIKEWIDKHIEEKHNSNRYAGAIGGQFTYEFIPTSIGTIGTIKCSCGDKFCFCELM